MNRLLMGLVVPAISVVLVLIGLATGRTARRHRREWTRADGVVLGESGLDGGDLWRPVVEFVTVDGQRVRHFPRSSSDIGVSAQGRTVPVWYDPADPRRFEAQVRWLDRPGAVFFLAAAGTAVVGLLTLWVALQPPIYR
jgi:hypothetical protein